MLLKKKKKKQWVNEEIEEEIKKYLETNDDEDTTYQNLWYAAKGIISFILWLSSIQLHICTISFFYYSNEFIISVVV